MGLLWCLSLQLLYKQGSSILWTPPSVAQYGQVGSPHVEYEEQGSLLFLEGHRGAGLA